MQILEIKSSADWSRPETVSLIRGWPFAQQVPEPPKGPAWALADSSGWQWLAGFEPLEFDSKIFGHSMAALRPLLHHQAWPADQALEQGRALLEHLVARAKAAGVECLVARVPERDFLAAQALEAAGARLMDVSVEMELDLAILGQAPSPPEGLELRAWQEDDSEPLARLCASSFCDLDAYADRFAMDPRLRPGCPELYRRWLMNSLAGDQADQVLVLAAPEPRGMISLKKGTADQAGWVVLNALDEALRGRGLYHLLLAHGLAWLRAQGAARARVRTKLSTRAVIQAWNRLGARLAGADLTFHLWLDQGES